jgi:hypothetical protein
LVNSNDKILLASAASRRKKDRFKLIVIAAVSLVVVSLTLLVFGTSTKDLKSEGAKSTLYIKPNQKADYNNSPDTDDELAIKVLSDLYSIEVSVALLALPENSIYGNQATGLVTELNRLFDTAKKSNQAQVVKQIKVNLGLAKELIDKFQIDTETAIARLNQAFQSLDAKSFKQELANLVIIAKNNEQVLLWQQKKNEVLEYFNYQLKADRARAEQRDEMELASLEKVVELGFGFSNTESHIARLKDNISSEKYAFHIKETIDYIDQGNFKLASSEIAKASNLFPNRAQIKELERTISINLKRIQVAALVAKADAYGQLDQWALAQKTYSEALSISKADRLASEGKTRAINILKLKEGLLDIYNRPLRLKDMTVLKFAQRLLAESKTVLDRSQSLKILYQDVDRLLSSKMVPRSVFIQSDGNARIRIQGVGFISPTEGKFINLTPGEYRFYAECNGYQTKLYEIIIPIDDEITPMRVICGDKI